MSDQAAAKDLLKFALKNQAEDLSQKAKFEIQNRNENEKEFLKEAIGNYMKSHKSPTDEMIEVVQVIKNLIAEKKVVENQAEVINLLQILGEQAENIDVACDLHKVKGFDDVVLKLMLDSNIADEVRGWCANVVGCAAQNNPYCQNKLFMIDVVQSLLSMTSHSQMEITKVKSVFAISALIRQNDTNLKTFINDHSNIKTLIHSCLHYQGKQVYLSKFHKKVLFLLRSLILINTTQSNTLLSQLAGSEFIKYLCFVISSSCDDVDFIECSTSLLLTIASRNKEVVKSIVTSSWLDTKRLNEMKVHFAKEDWTEISKNFQFIYHLVTKYTE